MKKSLLLLILWLLTSIAPITAQNSLWHPILSIKGFEHLEASDDYFYIVSQGNLFGMSQQNHDQVHLYGRHDGLSDVDIRAIHYHKPLQSLFVYYRSGKMDLLSPDGVASNFSFYENYQLPDKSLNDYTQQGDTIYLAGNFGILCVSLKTADIHATYHIGESIQAVATYQNLIYALKKDGTIMVGNQSHNLQDPKMWTLFRAATDSNPTTRIAILGDKMLLLHQDKKLSQLSLSTPHEEKPLEEQPIAEQVEQLLVKHHQVLIGQGDLFYTLDEASTLSPLPKVTGLVDFVPIDMPNKLWVIGYYSINLNERKAPNQPYSEEFYIPKYNAPGSNLYFYSIFAGNRYYAVGGGRGTNRFSFWGDIKILEGQERWIEFDRGRLGDKIKPKYKDVVSIAVDPKDPQHFYASLWGEGLLEFRADTLYRHYNQHNSSLLSVFPGSSIEDIFVRVGSLTCDKEGGLWMLQGSVSENILYLSPKGEWYRFKSPITLAEANAFGHSLVLPGGVLWSTVFHNSHDKDHGVLIFDTHGTLGDTSDDISVHIPFFVDRTGKPIATHKINTLALDHKSVLWLGSNKGPLAVANPSQLHKSSNYIATRPVAGQEPNLFYVLDNINITAIAIDKANQKWFGTEDDGLYLVNENATEIIAHYRQEDSPLLSNTIHTLALDPNSGLLYIGTNKGLITLQTGSFTPTQEQLNGLYAYPNPIRPEDFEQVTLAGVSVGMEVHLVDAQGNTLWHDIALQGECIIPLRNHQGERLPSGIYTILVVDPITKVNKSTRVALL